MMQATTMGSGTAAAEPTPARRGSRARDYLELTKPGITRMVLITAGVGFYMASRGPLDYALLAWALAGTALAASGTNALNQYVERDLDARMRRTRWRPLPAGRLAPRSALRFAVAISVLGLAELALTVNLLTAALVALSLLSYVFVYTPLKLRTPLSTVIGAVPGALPILAGWAAAGGGLEPGGWALFALLFAWQLPHFLALAWMYREDYGRGGYAMLSVLDPDGRRTGRHAFGWALALLPISILPALSGLAGGAYVFGGLALGLGFAVLAAALMRRPGERAARRLFFASLIYLPAILLLLVLNRP